MDTRELHPDPTYCHWCGVEEDNEGNCKAPEHCPSSLMSCPVCIDYGRLQGSSDVSGLECDCCERRFSYDDGVLEPVKPIIINDDDMGHFFYQGAEADDKRAYWNKIKHHVMAWEAQNNA